MIALEMTKEEAQALIDLLQYSHSELRMQIASTDTRSFRDQLIEAKAVLKGIRERLEKLMTESVVR